MLQLEVTAMDQAGTGYFRLNKTEKKADMV